MLGRHSRNEIGVERTALKAIRRGFDDVSSAPPSLAAEQAPEQLAAVDPCRLSPDPPRWIRGKEQSAGVPSD